MAGNPSRVEIIAGLEVELRKANNEVARLRQIIIDVDPKLLKEKRPVRMKKYSAKVIDQVYAMADMGKSTEEWAAAFGISMQDFTAWVNDHPPLQEAVLVALNQALAWWKNKSRLAQENRDQKFPMTVFNRRVEDIEKQIVKFGGGPASGDLGDASKLVILDLRSSAALDAASEAKK